VSALKTAPPDDLPVITARSWAMVATLGLVWGATFMGIELALEGFTPLWVATGRLTLAAALLCAVWAVRGGPVRLTADGRARWPFVLAVGLTGTMLPFMALSWGQTHVTSGFAGVCMAAVPLMVLPLAHVFVPGERLGWRRVAGFLVGFAGVAVLIGPGALASTGAEGEALGRLACLAAAGCYAVSSIVTRRCPPIDPVALASLTLLVGAAVALPIALAVDGPPAPPPAEALAALVTLALLPTAAATLLRVVVIRSAGPVFMNLVNYQVPVWSVVFGWALLGEALPPSLLTALALILAGLVLSQWRALGALFGRAA
jgi:drug/metabolite transporter (DMT)-like permease